MGRLISTPVPTVARGVTTVLPELRVPGETVESLNVFNRLTSGVTRRAPLEYLKIQKSSPPLSKGVFLTGFDRGDGDQYLVVLRESTPGIVQPYVLNPETGVEHTISNTAEALTYLNATPNLSTDIVALSLRDRIILVNASATVAAKAALGRTRPDDQAAILYVRSIAPDLSLSVSIDGGTVVTVAANLDDTTKTMAEKLQVALVAAYPAFTFTVSDGSIYVTKTVPAAFKVRVQDGLGGDSLVAVVNRVQENGDLPPSGIHGFSIEVVGSNITDADNYFLVFQGLDPANTTTPQRGTWVETFGPNESIGFENAPVWLRRTGATTWALEVIPFTERTAGDSVTAPMPGFVGKTINDVFFLQGRLGFLSGDRVTLSRAGDILSFFRKSALALTDEDLIDVGVASVGVADLEWAVPYNQSLIIFASNGQYELAGSQGILSPRSISASPIGTFGASDTVRPSLVGSSIVFTAETGGQSHRVYELAYYPEGRGYAFTDITARTTEYVKGTPLGIVGVPRENLSATVMTNGSVFVHQVDGPQSNRSQSAWSRWTTLGTLYGAVAIGSTLYLLGSIDSNIAYLSMDLSVDSLDPHGQYRTHLDLRVTEEACTISYDPITDTTLITGPWLTTGREVVVVTRTGTLGVTAEIISTAFLNIIVRGDWENQEFYLGVPYVSKVTLSPPYLANDNGPLFGGRVQVRAVQVLAKDTGFFEVEVLKGSNGSTATYSFTGRTVGVSNNLTDQVAISDVRKRFAVLTRNTDAVVSIQSDGILPFAILALEWESLYHRRVS